MILAICILFRNPIAELIRPNPNGGMTVRVGASGVEITRVAAAAAAVAVGTVTRADQDQQPVNRSALAANLAQGIEASLNRTENIRITPKLLWIDDNPSNNDYLVSAFRDIGIQIILAKSTEDAKKELTQKFNMVITDMTREPDSEAGLNLIKYMQEKKIDVPIIIYAAGWASRHVGQEANFVHHLLLMIQAEFIRRY